MKNCPNKFLIGLLLVGIMNSTNLFANNPELALSKTLMFVDADGDGDPDTSDPDDSDPCVYDPSTQVIGDVTAAWLALDCDGDTITNGDEVNAGTDPRDEDTDGDGDPDNTDTDALDPCVYSENRVVGVGSAAWNVSDCDGDGVPNGEDTNPVSDDADGDGDKDLTDPDDTDPCVYSENRVAADATEEWNNSDCDNDGLSNGDEVAAGTEILIPDTDGDGDLDGTDTDPLDNCVYSENQNPANADAAWNAADCDNDGVTNGDEIAAGTDEQNPDTDGDGDGDSTDTDPLDNCTYSENQNPANADAAWNAADCDSDGSTNAEEIAAGTDEQNPDTDGDGDLDGTDTDPLDNCVYSANQNPANADAAWNDADCDNDGSTNGYEIAAGTDEQNPDTDGDGDLDGTDTDPLDNCTYSANQNPANADAAWNAADCDNDGSTNGDEIAAGTDEQNPDTDGDGDLDGTDTDPLDNCVYSANQNPANADAAWNAADCDNDGSTNGAEIAAGTDEQNPDTDGDGDLDGTDTDPLDNCVYSENQNPANADAAWNAADCDSDGSTNGAEIAAGTDEQNPDTDGDGDLDGTDTDPLDNCVYSANQNPANADAAWNAADCDNDGSTNGAEIAAGTDEQNPDTDGDGDLDGTDSDPLDPCAYSSNQNTNEATAEWNAADCDGDTISNGQEVIDGTNPLKADTDGDGDNDNTDPDPLDLCVWGENQVIENAEPVWKNADCDNDGVINADDPAPLNPDRDGDGDLDGSDTDADDPCSWSENQDPANAEPAWANLDCDNDGLSNGEEVNNYGTDPRNEDTDGDGYSDPIEIRENSDPTDPNSKPDDCDGDFDPDSTDPDDDNDGVLDEEDAFICDPNRTVFLPTPSDYFTPNNDGFYDTWQVYKISEFPNNRVYVYTRNGQLIFRKNNYANDWTGIGNDGKNIPEGSYFYQVDVDGDNQIDLQGWIYIAR